ncbi:hypothetical protein ABEB36_010924 [Hypothenemus hampei]|uniref:Vitellogenin domain-containing protein n=1 Tax=Hypothenemus hampei TaxID=57062 RepID=A0ABD1EDJ0_HYPHA
MKRKTKYLFSYTTLRISRGCIKLATTYTREILSELYDPLKDPLICGLPTCSANTKFKYEVGQYYRYKYEIEARTLFNGTSKNESKLFIDADVTFNFLTPCNGLLTLSDVKLRETASRDNEENPTSTNSQLFSEMISETTLRFAFKDGIIYEICPDENEKNYPLNFKRGILSMIQNSMKRFDLDFSGYEEDVQGVCSTTYTVLGAKETSLLIKKTKDLDHCTDRIKINSIVQTTPRNFQTRTRDENILKSFSECTLSVDENIYKEIICEENYILEPFSNNAAGATTNVRQKLALKERGEKKTDEESAITRRTNLKFDHLIPKHSAIGDLKTTRDLIKKLCKESQLEYQSGFSDLFGKFVYGLRSLSYPTLHSFYTHSPATCPSAKKHILEALPYVNTAGSIGLIKDLVLAGTLPEKTVNDWMWSMAFISNPDVNMLESASDILRANPMEANIILSVASLTHTFCTLHADCPKITAVYSIVKHLEDKLLELLKGDPNERTTQDQIIVTLKALSTVGWISEKYEEELFKVVADSNLDVGVRVAAVETFRRLPCKKHQSYFESVFENQEQDTEVRIAAYLQLMRCPTYLLVRKISFRLREEQVNQVGSFVWSHLHNIIKSANPLKLEIQSLLSEEDLIEKFSTDIRKFSHNRDGSLYFDEYNIGGNYETNVLFSPSSYIPRAGMLNLTVDLFGKYVNLLEVQGRLEGFEHYVESLFGPGGTASAFTEKIEKFKTRWIRGAHENLDSRIEHLTEGVRKSFKQEPKVALGLKIFGNDLKYLTFKGDKEIKGAMEYFNLFTYLKHILSGREINYKKATMFLDSNYVVPTGVGLPLFLSALGTASVKIKLFGSLHAKKDDLELQANFEPSAAVDVSAEMSLSAFYASTAIKLQTDMQSSIAAKADLKIKGTKLVSFKLSLPSETVRIFRARSEILVKQIPQEGQKMATASNSLCSWSLLSDGIGLKLCFDYSYKNTSSTTGDSPFFALAGPANLNIYVEKSDPTANDYLFAYKWSEGKDFSVVSLTFDTPGSKTNRLMHANFTIEKNNNNLSMLIQSSAGRIFAKGRIKNTVDQKIFQMTLDINDMKHFDASLAYDRLKKVNGYTYKPKAYLGVNGERVLELQGSIDLISKKDISQYTVDLKFGTKRFASRLFGYVTKTDSSIGTDLNLDYKFVNAGEERVSLKFGLANRSSKNLPKFLGHLDVLSTAYPHFNFNSNATFRRSGSHVEFKVVLIQNPLPLNDPKSDFESLKFDFIFSHKAFTDSKQTIEASASVKRNSTNLDLKGKLLYETFNADINFEALVNYAKNKQTSLTVFWSHPRTTLEEIKAHVNLTIPSFTPVILKVEINEIHSKEYKWDISGTTFSNHSATIWGSYQDSSNTVSSNHHLKFFVKSPNFKEIDADLLFYRDNEELKIDVKATHDKNDYQLFLNHNATNELGKMGTDVRIKYKTKLYTLKADVNRGEHFKVNAELHLDQLRDIEFSVWIFNEELQKALGFDVNWDANRDPNQKLLVAANFSKTADFNYNTDLIVSYPGRTVIGKFEFLLERGRIDTLASISWDDGKSFAINLNVKYILDNEMFFEISARVNTPMDSFKNMKLAGVFEHSANKYSLNGFLTWSPRQKISVDIFGDYSSMDKYFDCRYSVSLQSTLNHIPDINATLKHFQNASYYDTIVHMMYNPEYIIDVDSKWKIQSDNFYSNLTGTVKTVSPFSGLQKGAFIGKVYYTADKHLRGVAEVDIDHKKMLVDMEGRFKKLMDSMFVANVTTPEETYQCQFKLSKKERHFVALITYPTGNLGTEVLFVFNDWLDFNVKLLLATPVEFLQRVSPIEFLQRVLIVGKLQMGEADFRIGWNSFLLGFSGRAHYVNMIDFEYACKIYMPIKDFEDNGVVVRLIFKEGLDTEISFKLFRYKLGVKIIGQPNPKPLKDVGINIGDVYYHKENSSLKVDDFISFKGLIELDAIIYPTMKGQLEIEQKGPVYVLQSKIHLPHGLATVFNEFEYIDVFSMGNTLRIVTPYKVFKTISSDFKLHFLQSQHYLFNLGLSYENDTRVVKTSVFAEYNKNCRDDDDRIYNVTVDVNTPFKAFPNLKLFGAFESETENFYRTTLLFTTNRSDIYLDATKEINQGWMSITSDFHVTTPIITLPETQLKLTKLNSSLDNYVEVHVKVPEKFRSEVYFRSSWLFKALGEFRADVELVTPFTGLENTRAAVDFLSTDIRMAFWTQIHMNPIRAEVNSTFENNLLRGNSLIQFNDNILPISVNCTISKRADTQRNLNGTLLVRNKVYRINGKAGLLGSLPAEVLITFTPKDNGLPLTFQYDLETTPKGYGLNGFLRYFGGLTHFRGNATANNKLNWEINLQIEPQDLGKKLSVHAVAVSNKNSARLDVKAITNIPKLEESTFGLNYRSEDIRNQLTGYFALSQVKGYADIQLILLFWENMLLKAMGNLENLQYNSSSQIKLFYKNPAKEFKQLDTGGLVTIDKLWETEANVSLKLPDYSDVNFEGHLKIPNDFEEIHSVFAKLFYTSGLKFVDYLLKYRSNRPLRKYGVWGEAYLGDKHNISGNAILEWNGDIYRNNGNLKRLDKSFDLSYKLQSPKYLEKDTFTAGLTYNCVNEHHNVTCKAFYPGDVPLLYATIDYVELENMFGILNVSLPHKSFNFTGADFRFETNRNVHNRFLKVFWPQDNALLDSKCDIKTREKSEGKHYKGVLLVQLPLATRHIGKVDYEYDKKAELSIGRATVEYNGGNVLEAKYNCLSKALENEILDKIHLELLNKIVPVGADYVHHHQRSKSSNIHTYLSLDNKHLHLYHLENRTKFNLTGEINVETHQEGLAYVVTATHLNRTVTLSGDYSIKPQEYKQHSRLQLNPNVWIEYDFTLINKTMDTIFDVEMFLINVSYPRRNFSGQAFYNISDSLVSTDISLLWDKDNKSVEAALDWRQIAERRKELKLLFKHPSLEKDVSVLTNYGRNGDSSLDGLVVIDYSTNPEQTVSFGLRAEDKSKEQAYNYSYNIWAEHNATNLYLNCLGHVHWSPEKIGTEHIADYKRSYLSLSRSLVHAKADFDAKEFELKREDIIGKSYFWARYGGAFPIYTANMTSFHGINYTSGKFYVNFQEKLLFANVNLTEDGSQSSHALAVIPDARSATFEIWRDYEDKRLTDVSYYLKLNHSRLIMSELKWRPELISDVQNELRSKALQLYFEALDQINNTRQYIRAETMDAIDGIWQDAKPLVSRYLQDLRNLTVVEEDFEYLRSFLNASYHNNEFYIKDICSVVMTLIDDLSIKSHLQSLPKILQELWTALGASGKNIKDSINYVIEKIKLYYNNTTKFIHDLINGDPVKHLGNLLEKMVDKYDDYIKNMHVSALHYIESLWKETYDMMVANFHEFLAALEPSFLKFVHYAETIIWTTGKEFLDFLYIRKNKIIESEYFMEFTKFSRDVDRFYKDITGNNTVEAIYKYGNIVWRFVNEKYINHAPFGKELKTVLLEIVTELEQLGDVPSIKYVLEKCKEMFETVKEYYEYLEIEYRTHKFIKFLYRKLSEMTITALEMDNRQREAKTKFIYEPNDGIMFLQQKLPMSWHGFNETPEFQEIPEIKVFYSLYNYLVASEMSFTNFYYNFISYTDLSEWLPPFKGHAMLIGGIHYVTFDKKYYRFQGSCTYLLATDVVNRNFTLLTSYDQTGIARELILLLNKTILSIDLFKDRVKVNDSETTLLPLQIGNNRLYRESEIITLRGDQGFYLECNVKYQICIFEVSGWHYGRTAGLWGTYNNEPSDDLSTPEGVGVNNLTIYGDSWIVNDCKTRDSSESSHPRNVMWNMCREFFLSKFSDLGACFSKIPKDYFLDMCLNSTSTLEACRSALSYIEMCHRENTPLNLPDVCIKCELLNGTQINEGEFVRLHGTTVPRSADVVFIVEAKKCNENLKNRKNFHVLLESINQELSYSNITNNRYAVVVFGGDGVFNAPRSIVLNSKTFTDANEIIGYFNVPVGNGNSDIYEAIIYTNKLPFRPGVSRNFILLPCSKCDEDYMENDYATVHQLLFDSSASLHILANNSLAMQKAKDTRVIYGVDTYKAYTKKDIKKLDGDQVLRNSISFSKSGLGPCFSLALETNGTIFSARHLENLKNAKKFSTVFAKRFIHTAGPRDCTNCECTSLHNGLSYMECTPCSYPRTNMEHHSYYEEDEF